MARVEKLSAKTFFKEENAFVILKIIPMKVSMLAPAQCLLPLSLLTEVKSSLRSVRFSCVCQFQLRFPDIRSRLDKNSKPKKFICIVRIQFFTILTKLFRRKRIIFRSKSRNKQETDYFSKDTLFSSQCSSGKVEYCYDKAVEIFLPISKKVLIRDQKKKHFITFLSEKAFFTKLFIWTRIFDNPAIFFPKIEILFARIPNWIGTFCVSFQNKFSKRILWTSKIHFWEPCRKKYLEVVKIFAGKPKRKTELNCFQKHIFFSQFEKGENFR